jgi:hypothetical protein
LFKNREKISLPDGEFNENLGSLQYKLYWACEKAKGWFEKPTNDFSSSKQPYLDTKL